MLVALAALGLGLAALPPHIVLHPLAPVAASARSRAFDALEEPVRRNVSAHGVTFSVALAAAEIGGIPRRLHAHLTLLVPPASGPTLVALRFNGALVGARELTGARTPHDLDIAIPAAFVGATNELRIAVGSPDAALAGTSSFGWDGLHDAPATVADFFRLAHGRGVILLDPAFRAAAANVVRIWASMNPSLRTLNVLPYQGSVPPGYDEAAIFAPPRELAAHSGLPLHGGDAPFTIVNPIDDAVVVGRPESATAATLQVGYANGTPLIAISYVAEPSALARLGRLTAADLDVQIGNVSLVTAGGITAYEVGAKLRIIYAQDQRLLRDWYAVRGPLAIVLLAAILYGGWAASRRLARKPPAVA